MNSFSHNGFRFDAGIRALENAGIIFPMLHELGINLDVVKSPVTVGIENEMLNITDINSLTEYGSLLKRLYPNSEAEIDRLTVIIRKVMKHMDVLYGIENPNFKDMSWDRNYLLKELLPWIPTQSYFSMKWGRGLNVKTNTSECGGAGPPWQG